MRLGEISEGTLGNEGACLSSDSFHVNGQISPGFI